MQISFNGKNLDIYTKSQFAKIVKRSPSAISQRNDLNTITIEGKSYVVDNEHNRALFDSKPDKRREHLVGKKISMTVTGQILEDKGKNQYTVSFGWATIVAKRTEFTVLKKQDE